MYKMINLVVAHFELSCFGNGFQRRQSRNVTWQCSHGTHLHINKRNDPEKERVQNTKRENSTTIRFINFDEN